MKWSSAWQFLLASSLQSVIVGCSEDSGAPAQNSGATTEGAQSSGATSGGVGTAASVGGGSGTTTATNTSGTSVGGASTGTTVTGGETAATSGGIGGAGPVSGSGGSSAASTTGGTGGTDDTVTIISELTIEPNPNNVLSCFVNWKTDVAASSVVQFGVDSYEWEISDPAPVTEHRVLVIGMHASQTYSIKAISGVTSAEDSFTTGELPGTVPVGTVTIHDEAATQPGWTLMNVQQINPSNAAAGSVIPNSPYPPQAVIYDEQGEPVWYYVSGTQPDNGGAIDVEPTDKGVLIGPSWNGQLTNAEPPREVDFAGNVLWECGATICGAGESISHHAGKLSNGDYVLIQDITTNGIKNPIFHEVTPDNQIVWSLEWTNFVSPPSGVSGDWCHGNSITIDIERDEVYANCRWFGLLKTTYSNPSYQWLLPASCASMGVGDFTFTGSQFVDSHDPEIHPDDNTVLFFDNGGWTTRCAKDEYHSRVVEYELDGTNATLVWEFPGSFDVPDTWYTDWYSPYWGDADRLENGNVLVAAGILASTMESRVFEVSKADGKVVWEFRLPNFYGMYRADRIAPPLVHPIGQ